MASVLGNAAAAAGRTDTFLGERYRRIARRRGAKRALVAVGHSILVITWHLLSDPAARYTDLGADYHALRIDPDRRKRNHIRQLEALGYTVTPPARRLTTRTTEPRLRRALPRTTNSPILGLAGGSSSSLHDDLNRVLRVNAKPLRGRFARAMTRRPRPRGWQLREERGKCRNQ